ncbi:MAG: hypothetical protein LUF85_00335 [Bacteroides sp.]|nr:hypothetical protein [Bacteroides sp.]
MKRTYFALAWILVGVLSGCGSGDIKRKKFMGISGNPTFVKYTTYDAVERFGEVIEKDLEEVQTYEFDTEGNVVKLSVYNYEGELNFTLTHTFENGKRVETRSYQRYNSLSETSLLTNRTSSQETWETQLSDGTITTTYIELEDQKKTEVVKDSEGNITSRTEQFFDRKGNLKEYKAYDENNKVRYWFKTTFDTHSRELTQTTLVGNNEEVYTYKYVASDDKGNWTKRIEYVDGELESVTLREIRY